MYYITVFGTKTPVSKNTFIVLMLSIVGFSLAALVIAFLGILKFTENNDFSVWQTALFIIGYVLIQIKVTINNKTIGILTNEKVYQTVCWGLTVIFASYWFLN